jgi:hypothetical protein
MRLICKTDPEISTLSTLTNVQNSLFVPDLGNLLNRMPTYNLTLSHREASDRESEEEAAEESKVGEPLEPHELTGERLAPVSSISSILGDRPFAVLPEGSTLEGWTTQDIEELNDHVRHMLHSRRSKFKRAMKGFGQYVKKRKWPIDDLWLDADAFASTGLLCYRICDADHPFRSGMGSFLDRYVLRVIY